MDLYRTLERINDIRALAQGNPVKRLIRRIVWRHGTNMIRKIVRLLGAA